jgi:hypothetical protein
MVYLKEELIKIIKDETSISSILRILGLSPNGGGKKIRNLIKEILIENGNYKGHAHNKGKKCIIIENEYFFIKGKKKNSFSLRRALFNRGIKEKKCENCNLSEWLGKEIPVEVHHIDGDKLNNTLENLQILCPNCHYFTDTYKSKNRKK